MFAVAVVVAVVEFLVVAFSGWMPGDRASLANPAEASFFSAAAAFSAPRTRPFAATKRGGVAVVVVAVVFLAGTKTGGLVVVVVP